MIKATDGVQVSMPGEHVISRSSTFDVHRLRASNGGLPALAFCDLRLPQGSSFAKTYGSIQYTSFGTLRDIMMDRHSVCISAIGSELHRPFRSTLSESRAFGSQIGSESQAGPGRQMSIPSSSVWSWLRNVIYLRVGSERAVRSGRNSDSRQPPPAAAAAYVKA